MSIKEIAKHLNLSITTVSRALDGYPDVAKKTRDRVLKTAAEMGYEPNYAARDLRRKKTDAIGFIRPYTSSRFADLDFSEFLSGLGDEAVRYHVDILVSSAPMGEFEEIKLYKRWVQSKRVDGFILTQLRYDDRRVQFLKSNKIPFSALECTDPPLDYPSVEILGKEAFSNLIDYLVIRGFHRIGFIGGPDELKIQKDRFDGFLLGLRKNFIFFDPAIIRKSNMTCVQGYQLAKDLLSNPDPPGAIICINDETAFGALHAAHERQLRVGRDIAITGFDGVQSAQYTEPPLTTLDIPVYDIARHLVSLLIDSKKDKTSDYQHITFQPRLLARDSA
jgi:LacI family transcriptional regulator